MHSSTSSPESFASHFPACVARWNTSPSQRAALASLCTPGGEGGVGARAVDQLERRPALGRRGLRLLAQRSHQLRREHEELLSETQKLRREQKELHIERQDLLMKVALQRLQWNLR